MHCYPPCRCRAGYRWRRSLSVKRGAKNAGYLAVQILAVGDPSLSERLVADKKAQADAVIAKDAALQHP